MGNIVHNLSSGKLDENYTENVDQTRFIVHLDEGIFLGFQGQEEVKYAAVTSGDEDMTMMVGVSGGVHSNLKVSFMIFNNKDRKYPIRSVPENIPGVCYRTVCK